MNQKHEHPENSFFYSLPPIRLGEFDMGGVLYHANYFHLYEQVREEFLRAGGHPYSEYVGQSCHLTVTESHQHFLSPVFYNVDIDVYLWLTELKRASVVVNYEIYRRDVSPEAGLLHRAWTRHAFVKDTGAGFEVERIPDELMEYFGQFGG